MRGVRGELPLNVEALFEPVERVIDRANQWRDLARQVLLGQTDRGGSRTYPGGHSRHFRDRFECALYRQNADCQGYDDEERDDPTNIDDKLAQQGVNQYVRL